MMERKAYTAFGETGRHPTVSMWSTMCDYQEYQASTTSYAVVKFS